MNWKALVAKLAQPSSFAGFAGLALVLGLSEPSFQAWANAIAAIAGLVAIARNEGQSNA